MLTLLPLPSECTFIVLDAEKWQAQPRPPEESCMVGDVNLFLTDLEDPTLGEIEVMIAGLSQLAQTELQRAYWVPRASGVSCCLLALTVADCSPVPHSAPLGSSFSSVCLGVTLTFGACMCVCLCVHQKTILAFVPRMPSVFLSLWFCC